MFLHEEHGPVKWHFALSFLFLVGSVASAAEPPRATIGTVEWAPLGSEGLAQSLSAGMETSGHADIFLLEDDGSVQEYRLTTGWMTLPQAGPGSTRSVVAADNGLAFVVNSSGALLEYTAPGWVPLTATGFIQPNPRNHQRDPESGRQASLALRSERIHR